MGTYAVGPLMTTKPYISGANYINKMSTFCRGCTFDPVKNCPIAPLYWAFLARHESALRGNPRLSIVIKSLNRRQDEAKTRDKKVYHVTKERLSRGAALRPSDLAKL